MANLVTQGMITITDVTDAPRIACVISPSAPSTQVYNTDGDTYRPNWSESTPLLLTPVITVNGQAIAISGNSKISNVNWQLLTDSAASYVNVSTVTGMSVTSDKKCKITKNMVEDSAWTFRFSCKYTDVDSSELTLDVEAIVGFNKTKDGGGVSYVDITPLDGTMIKNGSPAALRLQGCLYKGTGIFTDYGAANTSAIATKIAWFKMTDDGPGNTAFGVGEGWSQISNNIQYWLDSGSNLSAGTTVLTVPPAEIVNISVIMLAINDGANIYKRTISLTDYDDPYSVFIETIGGDKIKNGQGSIKATAYVYQGGENKDPDGSVYDYVWTKRHPSTNNLLKWVDDTTGKEQTTPSATTRTGREVTITGKNVDGKGIFHCAVYEKEVSSNSLSMFRVAGKGVGYALKFEYVNNNHTAAKLTKNEEGE